MDSTLQTVGTAVVPSLYDFSREIQEHVGRWQTVAAAVEAEGRAAVVRVAREWGAGYSVPTVYRKLAAWVESGRQDWTVFLDKRHWPDLWARDEERAVLPVDFLAWAGGRLLANQRASRPAWRGILAQWRRWHAGDASAAIPGYERCPELGPGGKHPLGWSYNNLMRRVGNTKAEHVIARIGTVAAREYLPCVPGTREGARWLEWVFFDDVWLDRLVLPPGYLRPVRVLQLGGMDLASGYYLGFGQRPDGIADADGVRERLKRRDFLFLVASLLDRYGYPADYDMHLVLERGTATMSAAEARVLYDVSGGRVQVCYTSMEGRPVMAWDEAKTGNSRGKALIESWHSLFHNEQAAIPGQVGMDRDHRPALTDGIERETVALTKVGAMLPADLRARLRLPIPCMAECYEQCLDVVERINRRTQHECEGFADVLLWRVPGTREWREERELAQVAPDMIDLLEWTTRKESPAERMARLSAGVRMARLPRNIWTRFYEDSHALARVRCAQIEVKAGGRVYLFGPEAPDAAIADGTEVLAYFSPTDPQAVHLTVGGRYVGSWPRLERVRRGDAKALADAIARKQRFLGAAVQSVRTKRIEELMAEERRVAANAETIAAAEWVAADATPAVCTTGAAALQAMSQAQAEAQETSSAEAQAASDELLATASQQAGSAVDGDGGNQGSEQDEEFLDSLL